MDGSVIRQNQKPLGGVEHSEIIPIVYLSSKKSHCNLEAVRARADGTPQDHY